MKWISKPLTCAVASIGLLVGCMKQDETLKTGTYNDLSSFAKNFIGISSSANTALTPSRNGAINQSFQGTVNSYLGASGQAGVSADTTIIGNPYQDCAKTTQIQNPDGSTTVVTDYGTGCTQTYGDWQSTQWGKSSYTYKNTSSQSGSVFTSQYYYRSSMDNFGGRNVYQGDTSTWLSNGHSTSTGTSSYDTVKQTFSGGYAFSDTSDFSYNKSTYSYKAHGNYSYSNLKSVEESNTYQYVNGSNYYQSTVTVPVVWDYSCNTNNNTSGGPSGMLFIQVPVSGHEIVKYSQDGVQGEFEIDYGNGTCDSLITIIENGKVIVIDLKNLPIAVMGG